MNLLRKTWGIVIAVIISSCHSATFDTISPDGTLKVGVVTTKDGDYGKAAFVVHYKGDSILFRSELGLETDAQKFAGNLRLKSVSEPKSVIDDYRMITGKRSHCVNEASERVYSLENDEGQTMGLHLSMGLRLFRMKNISLMNIRRTPCHKGVKDGYNNMIRVMKSFSRCLLMVSLPIARRLTFGDIRRL